MGQRPTPSVGQPCLCTHKDPELFDSGSPIILAGFAGVVGLAVVAMLMGKLRFAMIVISGMLLLSSMGVAVNYFGREQILLVYPIQSRRSDLFMALGATLFVTMVAHLRFISIRRISGPGIILLLVSLYAALLQTIHDGPSAALQSFAFAIATIVPLLLVIPAVLQERRDWFWLLRAIMFANGTWLFFVFIQMVANYRPMIMGRGLRFAGLTGNPQHASVLLACMAVIALWLALNDARRLRLLWAGMLGVTLIFLAWTGSRTGLGMFVIGTTATLYARMGRTILILPVIALAGAVGFKVFQSLGIDLGIERLASTANTRDEAWGKLFQAGLESPIIGVGVGSAGDTENSYLLAFASYGIGMVALVCLLALACMVQSLRLLKRRWALPPSDRTLIDLIISIQLMYFAGAVFEGYILARVGAPLMFLLIFSSMGSALISLLDTGVWTDEHEDEYEYEDEYENPDEPPFTDHESLQAG